MPGLFKRWVRACQRFTFLHSASRTSVGREVAERGAFGYAGRDRPAAAFFLVQAKSSLLNLDFRSENPWRVWGMNSVVPTLVQRRDDYLRNTFLRIIFTVPATLVLPSSGTQSVPIPHC